MTVLPLTITHKAVSGVETDYDTQTHEQFFYREAVCIYINEDGGIERDPTNVWLTSELDDSGVCDVCDERVTTEELDGGAA